MSSTVLITGASRGIGKAAAIRFAEKGNRVILHYYQSEKPATEIHKALSQQGYPVMLVQGNVADRTDVENLFAQARDRFGPIDVLVNNAGIAQQKLFTDISPEEWDTMFDVHVKGTFHCCQCALKDMIARHEGKIINVSSIWGITGASCEVHYSAAKSAVIGLTKALAKELGPSNIQVNCVAPGVIDTGMNAALSGETIDRIKEETPLGTIGTQEDVAHLICFLASKKADFITGQVISPNGGFLI